MRRIDQKNNSPVYYQFDSWQKAKLRHGVFTRIGGVSAAPWASLNVGGTVGDDLNAVAENHRLMYQTLDLNPNDACTVWQVHGVDTVVANGALPQRKWVARADSMVTNRVGLALTMRFADCVPVLFFDEEHHAIGITHAGWRGTVNGAVTSTLEAMQAAYGSRPENVQACIGPSIGPDHYQVGEEVVEAVQEQFSTTNGFIQRADDGSAYFNLWQANRQQLEAAGVVQIEVAGICTASNTDEFFSHRAEKGKTGRFGAIIALSEQ